MAGRYPDVIGPRMAYDRDGSVVVLIDGDNVITELTGAQAKEINDEDAASIHGDRRIAVLFPELRDLVGYFARMSGFAGIGALEASIDTSNGLDGTWTTVVDPWINAPDVVPSYRSAIQAVSATGKRAVRFAITPSALGMYISALHLYGAASAGETTYLHLWDPALSQDLGGAALDFGDVPRGSSADRTFRVKNAHPSLTAQGVTLTLEALTDTTPSVPGQFLLSTDGATFGAQAGLGNLGPGAVSGLVTIRRNTPVDAALGLWAARVVAAAGSWA